MTLSYVKPKRIVLRDHPDFNEGWLRDRIVDDPSILGLGEVEVREVEKALPKAGRLDILLRDPETSKRYEVELMLGPTDESHIIRTLEYWDVERKRYPQYDHTAVIVAENITSRFLNVIGLFNSAIPLIAIQLNAFQLGDNIMLTFTKVLDEVALGQEDEDDSGGQTVDRAYWESRGSKKSLAIADECLAILQEINPSLELKYNKYYIGLAESGKPNNFIVFRAKKHFLRAEVKISAQEEWTSRLEEGGLVTIPGETIKQRLHFRIAKDDISKKRDRI